MREKSKRGWRPRLPENVGLSASIMALPVRYRKFASGELSVGDMDLEELQRGQLRDLNGHFTGRPPNQVPLKFYHAMQAEYIRRIKQDKMSAVEQSYDTLIEIIGSRGVPGDARVKAATQLLDRLEGAVGSKIEISGEIKAKWESLLSGDIEIDLGEVPAQIEAVLDAVIVEDDEE